MKIVIYTTGGLIETNGTPAHFEQLRQMLERRDEGIATVTVLTRDGGEAKVALDTRHIIGVGCAT